MHQLDASGGFTTSCEAEIYLPDSDDVAQLIESSVGNYTGVLAYYKDGKNTRKVTEGDQTTPKRLTYLYINKLTATKAVKREYKQLKADK